MSDLRWNQMTSKARAYLLFKKIDSNTRAVAKLGSAIWYLSYDMGLDVQAEAPDLLLSLRTLMRERRVLREALETELNTMWRESQAKAALNGR